MAIVACVVALPATNLYAVSVVFAVELVTTRASTRALIWKPLIGPNEMVPLVTPAELQVPPTRFVLPTLSVQVVVYEKAIATHSVLGLLRQCSGHPCASTSLGPLSRRTGSVRLG